MDTYGRDYNGHVDSIAAATGSRYSLLPPENATGNYVKVVQRIPVKILFDRGAGPGPSVEARHVGGTGGQDSIRECEAMNSQAVPAWVAMSAAVITTGWLIVVVLSLVVIHVGERVRRPRGESDDRRVSVWWTPTPRWVLIVTAMVVALSLTVCAFSLVGIYAADELMHPSLNEHSVPPARAY